MTLPKELTTVTRLSKYLAMLVFIALPIVGFLLGVRYQEMLDLAKRQDNEQNLAIPRVPTPTPLAIPTTDPSITATWNTYRNSTYRFSFKYPNKGKVEETNNDITMVLDPGVYFNPGSGIYFVVEVLDNPENLSLEKFFEDDYVKPCDFSECENVIINGLNALKVHDLPAAGAGYVDEYYLQNGKNIYRLGWHSSYTEEKLEDQILSTFKFTQ